MTLPLTKTLDPADFDHLAEELAIVDQHFHSVAEQHPMRRWEYAMALRALHDYLEDAEGPRATLITDVGGAGSPFRHMLATQHTRVQVVDPKENISLERHVQTNAPLTDVVFCLSVLEHVEDLDQFLYHLSCLVAPGGLLFLTMDCCGCDSHDADMEIPSHVDRHHFHWMRQRIFGRADLRFVAERLLDYEFSCLGERDLTYHGAHVYDYNFASLALVKRV